MKRTITIAVDQLFRRQPGGIGTYVRGLAQGLASLEDSSLDIVGLAPLTGAQRGAGDLPLRLTRAPLPLELLTRLWPMWPIGVSRQANVVHATSMTGPFAGGAGDAVHSVAMHDLLWRDEPDATTASGVRFHESRLKLIVARRDLRIIVTSPDLRDRLGDLGIDPRRIHETRIGVDDDAVTPAGMDEVRELLATRGVRGPFTLFAGTIEPRKNIERLVEAHDVARRTSPELGALVIVGPRGWGQVATGRATLLGRVSRAMLKGLFRDAAVFAYVPKAEGYGLPPVEALRAGPPVVASTATPSVRANVEVVLVDPLDVASIAEGLVVALARNDAGAADRRRESVAELTWHHAALDHLAAWT